MTVLLSVLVLPVLPHRLPEDEVSAQFERAIPDPKRYAWSDVTPQEELCDPVPALARQPAGRRPPRVRRARPVDADEPPTVAFWYEDASDLVTIAAQIASGRYTFTAEIKM